ncbi:MAG: TIGR03960 family B12-binding radical SAM protein [Desulfuromonas sp.]
MMNSCTALLNLSRPGRYTGGEVGSCHKDPAGVAIHFALAFPDVYEIGMSHIGSAILYEILNHHDWIAAERVYCPWPDRAAQLQQQGAPLTSLESHRPLRDFDLVGFSLQYELCYTNLLHMLDLAAIARRRDRRGEDDPLIIVGGPCAYNPEPLADFIDLALLGDGEEAVVEICAALRLSQQLGENRRQKLNRLGRIEGVYRPDLFNVRYAADGRIAAIEPRHPEQPLVRRRFVADLDATPFPRRPLVPTMHTVHNRVAIEIARGCTRGCRFCQAGYIYRPVRERQATTITELAATALQHSGHEDLSLLSLSSGDYSAIEPLLAELMARHSQDRIAVSLPSLRVGSLSTTLIEEIRKVRKTGFTLAPEAGSERLRQVINKGIVADDLISSARTIYQLGWRLIKLYFMIGLPTEEQADLQGIIDLAAAVKKTARGTEGGGDVHVSASTFVPKPHTPFQWHGQISLQETRRRQQWLREALASKKLRLKWHEPELSLLEGIFARGDRRLGALLERAVDLGCGFDGWRDHFRYDRWQQALTDCAIDPDFYLRPRDFDEVLPWEHLSCGIPKEFFRREAQRALDLAPTPDCRSGACSGCGVCDFDQLRMRSADPAPQFQSPAITPAITLPPDSRFRLRLQLAKEGPALVISHLEFMSLVQRALRRMKAPLRYSQGFHPHPRLSFPDALPTGVASRAEIVDIELIRPWAAADFGHQLNAQLPAGFAVLAAWSVSPQTASPAASIVRSDYRVPLNPQFPPDLAQRLQQALTATSLPWQRQKEGKTLKRDLRPDIADLHLDASGLLLSLYRGSPVAVAACLLDLDDTAARALGICKQAVHFTPAAVPPAGVAVIEAKESCLC